MSAVLAQFQRTLESPAVINDPAYQVCYEALALIADRARKGGQPVTAAIAKAELLRMSAWAEAFASDLVAPLDHFLLTLEEPTAVADPAYGVIHEALAGIVTRGEDADSVLTLDQARSELLRLSAWATAIANDMPTGYVDSSQRSCSVA